MTETMENEEPKNWTSSVLLKVGIIAIIVLALLIPSSWIQDLIVERDGYHEDIIKQVASKWAGSQLIQGPVLVLPYKKQVNETNYDKKTTIHEVIETAYVLPETLKIRADLKTDLFKQGVTDITVYNAKVLLQGYFHKPDLSKLGINPSQVMYDKAKLFFSLSDLKGLKSNTIVKINNQDYNATPVYNNNSPYGKGLQVDFAIPTSGNFSFSYTLDMKGSNDLNFLQTANETDVEMTSDWATPQFNGHYPDSRIINNKGFIAKWHIVNYGRSFPQQWVNNDSTLTSKQVMTEAVSGVKLCLAINQYREVLRTTKYSTLIILLTFVSLFFTELIRKQRIHLFNYTLIGAAMVVYYTLLLSFAEQLGYNWAYLIASVATIGLIAAFTSSLLKNRMAALLFMLILTIFYVFIYVIVQLEEFSLMVGSIALFLIVSALMYFSRKINWDKH
jgi:inner membrane protein